MSFIIYEKKDNVAWITLNRPDVLNAQNDEVFNTVGSFGYGLPDPEVKQQVLT